MTSLNRRLKRVGEVEYLFAWAGSNWHTHKDLADVPPKRILFVDTHYCNGLAAVGHLMASYAFLHKQALALVVDGNIRDVDRMDSYPVWSSGFSPVACEKRNHERPAEVEKLKFKYQGGIMVCDDTGAVMIETGHVTQDTYQKLVKIKEREQDWYEKLKKGLSTFEITCLG